MQVQILIVYRATISSTGLFGAYLSELSGVMEVKKRKNGMLIASVSTERIWLKSCHIVSGICLALQRSLHCLRVWFEEQTSRLVTARDNL